MCQHMTGELHLHQGKPVVMMNKMTGEFIPVHQGQLSSKNCLFFQNILENQILFS